jgi:branched-chain amino acid transport system substrate-binding protein
VDEALHPNYFRLNNDSRQSMQAGAKYIAKYHQMKNKLKIAYVGPDYDYGYQVWSDLRIFLNKEDIDFEVVGEFYPKLFEKDINVYINALIDSKPDIVISGQWGQDFIHFIRQAKPFEFFDKTTLMNFDSGGNYEILSSLGEDMPLGLVLSARHHINWPSTKNNLAFVQKFREQVGRYPGHSAQGAYSGIIAIAKVVNISGGIGDKEKLRRNFKNLEIILPEDPDGFISRMDPDSHQILQVQAIGVTVKNTNYAPAKVMLGEWFVHYPPTKWPSVKSSAEVLQAKNSDR